MELCGDNEALIESYNLLITKWRKPIRKKSEITDA